MVVHFNPLGSPAMGWSLSPLCPVPCLILVCSGAVFGFIHEHSSMLCLRINDPVSELLLYFQSLVTHYDEREVVVMGGLKLTSGILHQKACVCPEAGQGGGDWFLIWKVNDILSFCSHGQEGHGTLSSLETPLPLAFIFSNPLIQHRNQPYPLVVSSKGWCREPPCV